MDQNRLKKRLGELTARYQRLLNDVRREPRAGEVEQAALSALSEAIEELAATAQELRNQNAALRDAYAAVEKERLHYEELYGLLPDAYLVTDAFGTLLEVNATGEQMLGVPAGRMRGKPLAVYIAEEDRKTFRNALNRVPKSEKFVEWSGMVTPRGGMPFRASARIARIADTGDRVRLGWMMRDASEKHRAATLGQRFAEEQGARIAAERANRRFKLLAEAGRHLSSGHDVNAICTGIAKAIVKFSADHCEILLLEGDELKSIARVNRDPKQAAFVTALRRRHNLSLSNPESLIYQAMRTRVLQVSPPVAAVVEASKRHDLFAAVRNATKRNAVVVPISRNEQSIGVIVVMAATPEPLFGIEEIGVLTEISERMNLAIANALLFAELERANLERAEFLAVLSHELRTPISAVIGYSDVLLSTMPAQLTDTAREHIERIRTCAWHQIGVVEQILTFARVEQKNALDYSEASVSSLTRDTLDMVRPIARGKDIKLSVDMPETDFVIKTDSGSLRQILVNLLSNAIKFTDLGVVLLSVRRTDEHIYFTISDTGNGIAANDVERIFDPFWRGIRTVPGMGLGLSVSRRLTQSLAGELTVASQVNVGTQFTLKLPIAGSGEGDSTKLS